MPEEPGRSQLRKSDVAELYDILISELTDFVVVLIDRQGRFESWNRGVEVNLGYSSQEFIGQPVDLIFTPEEVAAGVPAREMTTAAERGRASDVRWHVRKDGSRIFVDGVLVALRSDGHLLGFSKVMRDITDRKKREERLLKTNDELQHFVYAATHDIQEPLRNIHAFSEILTKRFGAAFDPEATQFLRSIRDAAARLEHLIRSLLEYSQTGEPVMRDVRVDDALDAALVNLHAALQRCARKRDPGPTAHASRGPRSFYGIVPKSHFQRLEVSVGRSTEDSRRRRRDAKRMGVLCEGQRNGL